MAFSWLRSGLVSGFAFLALTACGSSEPSGRDDGDNDDETAASNFPAGQGQAPATALAYPSGPVGINQGSIIPNLRFVGYANPQTANGALQFISLAAFYNPTGSGTFAEGSGFPAGTPQPKSIILNVGSVWCPPCNAEADVSLPVAIEKYRPMGGEVFFVLADGPEQYVPALVKHLNKWTTKYEVDYPAAIDPSYQLADFFKEAAFPQNFIIDTRTMRIVKTLVGGPGTPDTPESDKSFWMKFEKTIQGI